MKLWRQDFGMGCRVVLETVKLYPHLRTCLKPIYLITSILFKLCHCAFEQQWKRRIIKLFYYYIILLL